MVPVVQAVAAQVVLDPQVVLESQVVLEPQAVLELQAVEAEAGATWHRLKLLPCLVLRPLN
jgi:hypothetical protein